MLVCKWGNHISIIILLWKDSAIYPINLGHVLYALLLFLIAHFCLQHAHIYFGLALIYLFLVSKPHSHRFHDIENGITFHHLNQLLYDTVFSILHCILCSFTWCKPSCFEYGSLNLAYLNWTWLWLPWYIHVGYCFDCFNLISIQFCHRLVETIFVHHGSFAPRNHTASIHWNTAVNPTVHCWRFRQTCWLSLATIKQASTTPKHAQNQLPSDPHQLVYH